MFIRRHPLIVSKRVKGNWIILEQNKRYIRELNEVAGDIWGMLSRTTSDEAIIEKLSVLYDQRVSILQEDVKNFITEYIREGFIEVVKEIE